MAQRVPRRSLASQSEAGGPGSPSERDGEWAKEHCPNAQLAQRRSLRRVPALPAPGHDQTRADHATGDDMEAIGVSPHSPVQ